MVWPGLVDGTSPANDRDMIQRAVPPTSDLEEAPVSMRRTVPWPGLDDALEDDSFEPPWLAEVPPSPPPHITPPRPTNPYVVVADHTEEEPPPASVRRFESARMRSAQPSSGSFVVVEEVVVRTADSRAED